MNPGYTQTDMKYFDRIALGRESYVATPEESVTGEITTRSFNPTKEEAATP